jgi:hypothetical protein
MLQFHAPNGGWEHRAFWGADKIPWGRLDTPSRRRRGGLPEAGVWVRLEVPAADVGLAPGAMVNGWAFSQWGGTAHWDTAGVRSRAPEAAPYRHSIDAWETRVRDGRLPGVDAGIAELVRIESADRTAAQQTAIERHYVRRVFAPARARFREIDETEADLVERERVLRAAMPSVPVMEELPAPNRRATHVHRRGSFLAPGDRVTAAVPAALHPFPADAPRDRLGLAAWLVADDNPLTARVQVNRVWEQLFGTGLVETAEDFGLQGAPPSHPALLDWLATEFVRLGWSHKALCRTIVTSATYRQSSDLDAARYARDPRNRLLARGPRFRLEAEMIRDQALAIGNLLSPTMYGPPVFPEQPGGVWQIVYSNDRWETSTGDDRYRRALYTFWRRTSPYPSMVTFDAPSREFCVSRRIRTNTPLQALVTLNDPVFVDAARGLARRTVADGGSDDRSRAAYAFRLCTCRPPTDAETDALVRLLDEERAHYGADLDAARRMAWGDDEDEDEHEGDGDPVTLAAWTVVGNVLLNLDETLVKR